MARRVNTQFLVIFSVIVVGGVLAAFIVAGPGKYWFRGNPSKHLLAEGDALVASAGNAATPAERKDKLDAAVRNFQQAIAADPKNAELWVRVGDVLSTMAPYDPMTYIAQSRGAWEKALEINPDFLPALRRLQDSYYREMQLGGQGAGLFSRIRERAAQVHKLDPKDVRSEALTYIPVLAQWAVANIETSEADVDAAIAGLTPLIEQHPDAPDRADMVYYVARAKNRRGLEARRSGQSAAGDELMAAAAQTFDDALKGHESDAALHLRYYDLLQEQLRGDYQRDAQKKYVERMSREAEAAVKLTDPVKDPDKFQRAHADAMQVASARRDLKRADEVAAALYKALPDDQEARLAVAREWRQTPSKRDDAIALLEKPLGEAGGSGVDARMRQVVDMRTQLELADLYVERYMTLKEADRPAELKKIESTYDRLVTRGRSDTFEALKLRGRIELLKGGEDAQIRAIQTLEKAQAQAVVERGFEDPDVALQLGKAYLVTRQSGQARTQLQKYLRVAPDFLPARLMLAQLAISEGDMKGATEQLDIVEKRMPNEPEFLRLKLATLKSGDAVAAKTYYDRLPEDVPAGSPANPTLRRRLRLQKAALAPLAPISNPADALRLYNLVLADNPADIEALQGARSVLVAQGKKDEAIALLSAGQAKATDPTTADRIGLLVKQLKGASSEELRQAAEELLSKQEDPLTRELKLYELGMAANDRTGALNHLRAAEQIKWDDTRVLDQMFQYYAGARDWDKATWYVDRLAEKNADQAGGLIYRTRLSLYRGDTDAAMDTAREMTVRLKEFAPSWVLLGQAQQAARRYDDAIASYTAALEKQSENADAIDGIVNCYYALKRPADALQYIQRGLRANPNNARLLDQWRNYQLSPLGDPTLLLKPALAERDASPKNPAKWMNLGRAQLAAAQRKDKDSARYAADAKATFSEAVKQWPGERAFWAYLYEVTSFTGDKAGGEALLKDMLGRPEFKNTPETSMMLADHYLRNGDPAAAEAAMKQGLDRLPGNVELRRRLAAYYTQTGRFAEALELLDPASPDKMMRQQVVEVYMLDKQFGKAEGLLNKLLADDPKDAQLVALLGVVYLNQEKTDKALATFDKALAIDPKNQAALYSRGATRLGGNNPQIDAAIADLTTLRDEAPNHVDARVSLAEAYRMRQQYDAAARELEEVLKIAPGRRDVRASLVRLYTNSFRPPALADAERLIEQAKQLDPRDVGWPRMLASLYAQRGAFERAVREIEGAVALDQKNAREVKDYRPASDLLRDYLDVLEQAHAWGQLVQQTDRVLQDKDAAATAWWVYAKRGAARANTGRKADALADFQRAMEIAFNDKNAGPDAQTAVIDKIADSVDAATAAARVGELAKQPGVDGARWQVVLAALTLRGGDRAKAITQVDEARPKFASFDDRGRVTALEIAGNIYMAGYAADPNPATADKARGVYEDLLKARPDDLNALNNLANIYSEVQTPPDLPKALECANKAYEILSRRNIEPVTAANLLDTIGWVNVLSGGANIDRGMEYLNNSIRASEMPEAHYHLGMALLKKKSPVPAKRSLIRANELLQAKEDAKQEVDKTLKAKVDQALAEAEKASFGPRAGTP